MSIFKDCDIRGIYGTELNAGDGYRVGRALATLSGESAALAVGGDVRLSTPELKARLIAGLLDGGARVYDLGTIATPVLYYALKHLPVAGGAMVTASHNPKQYNGIKFMLGDRPVTRELMNRLQAVVEQGAYISGAGDAEPTEIIGRYTDMLAARFGGAKGKVVVDAGNGAMCGIAPEAFRRCGYQVVELFCEPDGSFPNRTPNPAEYGKLTALQARVLAEKADYGVAFDGDGDRAVFVDDQGQVVISERALVLFVRHLLKEKPTAVVYDQKSSSVVKKAVEAVGGTPVPERSGHTFIKRRFLDLRAAVAGEVSGHFFFQELGYDDGLFAALMMGEALHGQRMSDALRDVICPPITPDLRFACAYGAQDALLKTVEQAFQGSKISHLDGVRVELEDGWFLLRKSVTAEQVTLRVEGETETARDRILEDLARIAPTLSAARG